MVKQYHIDMKHAPRKAKTMANQEYLIVSEVAQLKQVTPATVRSWDQKGVLKATRTPNGTRLFLRQDVEKFIVPSRRTEK
jgi:predicted site-specific integrase-resolvase